MLINGFSSDEVIAALADDLGSVKLKEYIFKLALSVHSAEQAIEALSLRVMRLEGEPDPTFASPGMDN